MKTITFLSLCLCCFLVGCNLATSQLPTPTFPPPADGGNIRLAQVQSTAVPTVARDRNPIPTLTPTEAPPTPTLEPYTCEQNDDQSTIQHRVVANIDYATKSLSIAQATHYVNRTDESLTDIVLDVEANNWENAFSLQSVTLNGEALDTELDANRLTVTLPTDLELNCQLTLNLDYDLQLPEMQDGGRAYRGFFGFGERQMNLGHWLTTVAIRRNETWVVHDPITIGEQIVFEQADWDVTLNISNADDMKIAAPGIVEQLDEDTWHILHTKSRDFAISLSENFLVSQQESRGGVVVEVYSFGDTIVQTDSGTSDGAQHALREATQSLEIYEDLFGPYPYDRMVVVQGDFPDGMEFSGIVFVSTAWFYYFDGTQYNYLTLITVHEISHQWWYARVGNDSALAPWLDEALATYSEYLYIEQYYPADKNWWWTFRVANFFPQGFVDSTVYEFSTARDYINAVYLRGVQMLHNLREDIGDEDFIRLLYDYAVVGNGDIATPDLFWSLLTPEQLEATQRTRGEFLQEPEVLPDD